MQQTDPGGTFSIQRSHLDLHMQPDFLTEEEANHLLGLFIDTLSWEQPRVKVWGKWHLTPRLVCFFGDDMVDYGYSDTLHNARHWTPELLNLKQRISQASSQDYNAVLLNYYRDGQDTMGWHADNEAELGENPIIASLSLGAARDILFKPSKPETTRDERIRLSLPSGSLLIVRGDTQQHWLHHIPKRTRCMLPRVNLTFRKILSATSQVQ